MCQAAAFVYLCEKKSHPWGTQKLPKKKDTHTTWRCFASNRTLMSGRCQRALDCRGRGSPSGGVAGVSSASEGPGDPPPSTSLRTAPTARRIHRLQTLCTGHTWWKPLPRPPNVQTLGKCPPSTKMLHTFLDPSSFSKAAICEWDLCAKRRHFVQAKTSIFAFFHGGLGKSGLSGFGFGVGSQQKIGQTAFN